MRFENIRNLREDHDKLQIELAAYLNVKQTTYSKSRVFCVCGATFTCKSGMPYEAGIIRSVGAQ